MSGLTRPLPSIMTGPRLLKGAMISVPIDQCPNRVSSIINRRRIDDSGAAWTVIEGTRDRHYASGALCVHGSL